MKKEFLLKTALKTPMLSFWLAMELKVAKSNTKSETLGIPTGEKKDILELPETRTIKIPALLLMSYIQLFLNKNNEYR